MGWKEFREQLIPEGLALQALWWGKSGRIPLGRLERGVRNYFTWDTQRKFRCTGYRTNKTSDTNQLASWTFLFTALIFCLFVFKKTTVLKSDNVPFISPLGQRLISTDTQEWTSNVNSGGRTGHNTGSPVTHPEPGQPLARLSQVIRGVWAAPLTSLGPSHLPGTMPLRLAGLWQRSVYVYRYTCVCVCV